MHADADSSKLPSIAPQVGNEVRGALADNGGNRAGVAGESQLGAFGIGDANPVGKGARKVLAEEPGQRLFAATTSIPGGHGGIGGEDAGQRLRQRCHRGK